MPGIDKIVEKDINLAIAKKLKTILEEENYTVVMTRTKDEGLYDKEAKQRQVQDLQRRCELIEETEPVLTVSIHQNAYQDSSVCGPQVFYYSNSEKGKALAEAIQEQLNKKLDIEKPRVAKGNTTYYLLKKSEGVLAIVETGFLTNEEEAELLVTEKYQQKVAKAIYSGIADYLEDKR